jgi:hypothetical protein
MTGVDTTKTYMCYYCDEEVEFRSLTPEERKILVSDIPPQWYHVATASVSCGTVATPSNFELE